MRQEVGKPVGAYSCDLTLSRDCGGIKGYLSETGEGRKKSTRWSERAQDLKERLLRSWDFHVKTVAVPVTKINSLRGLLTGLGSELEV